MKSLLLITLSLTSFTFAEKYLFETFSDDSWSTRWIQSTSSKESFGSFNISRGSWFGHKKASLALRTTEDNKHYAISIPLLKTLDNSKSELVIQYTVKFENNVECGGAYLKLLPVDADPLNFDGDSDYNLMFGPDTCGGVGRAHGILNYKNENYEKLKNLRALTDHVTHAYTLVIRPDQTYTYYLDGVQDSEGTIYEDWNMLGTYKIPDPNQSKPEDWVDEEMMDDPDDIEPTVKAPQFIPDDDAEIPEDWDVESDGDWERPSIPNPDYVAEWKPKRIKNPKYQGAWEQPLMVNPQFKLDSKLAKYKSGYLGIEIWQVKAGTLFDDIMITDKKDEALKYLQDHILPKIAEEKEAKKRMDNPPPKVEKAEKVETVGDDLMNDTPNLGNLDGHSDL